MVGCLIRLSCPGRKTLRTIHAGSGNAAGRGVGLEHPHLEWSGRPPPLKAFDGGRLSAPQIAR